MLEYDDDIYLLLMGNITHTMLNIPGKCVSQCTGCMCNCRCSCSGGKNCEFEWEDD